MELLSSSNNSLQHGSKADSKDDGHGNSADKILFAGILESFNAWDLTGSSSAINIANTPPHGSEFITNANNFGFWDTPVVGAHDLRSLKSSPDTSHSNISCGWCNLNASQRCLDCNEFLCKDCIIDHRQNYLTSTHIISTLPAPIGTSPTGQLTPDFYCDIHAESLRYVCEHCKKLICQGCTLREHKDHNCVLIQNFVEDAGAKVDSALESSRVGTKCIKGSIDTALAYIRLIERDCMELSDNIRKAFRQFLIAIEDRERFLLDLVQKMRQRRLAVLHEQMAGLKSALSGLAETSEMLRTVVENDLFTNNYKEIAVKITSGERQLEQFASIYKDLQPKKVTMAFLPPDFGMLQELRSQGDVVLVDDKQLYPTGRPIKTSSLGFFNRQIIRENSIDMPSLEWGKNPAFSGIQFGTIGTPTQCIAGSPDHVKIRNSGALSLSFAIEGYDDGKVSRPWGVCVDKNQNIIISDRRNNRIQVFSSDGMFKFKFGRKGVGNGEFDLPAGICVDLDNRIIVVDKDNHRVQVFTSSGVFLLKFGKYGKEYGQFQYPWDLAVNSRRQIVVTDSRNNRIQQFDSEGRFIRQLVFDNSNLSKGIASPRGVCYTPQGNIIVSDFDNHCLYLIDADLNEILLSRGQEGSGLQEFNRPSGLCCDDEGRVVVADSKNQRVIVLSPNFDYLWDIEIRPSKNPTMPSTLDEKDRTCDVALMPDGRVVFLIELSPDSKEGYNPHKKFVHVY